MTRSNIHIKLSDGHNIRCVCDSSTSPEQGYFVEHLLLPLLNFNDADKELQMLSKNCAMHEQRAYADYRYVINLQTKNVQFFDENYDIKKDRFYKGENLTNRYLDYIENTPGLKEQFAQIKSQQI